MNRVTRTAPDGWPRLAVRMALSRRPAYLQEKATDFVDCGESVAAATLTARRLFSNDALAAFGLDYPGWRAAQYLPEEASPLTSEVAGDAWATVRAVETKFYLGNMLLPDSDCFSMAHGLEMRLPLLDRRILDVAFSFTCPTPIGLTPRVNKPWLVRAMGRDLSPQLVGRRKRGFSLPQARWMAGPLKDEFHERLRYLATSGIIEPRMIFPTWEAFLEAPAATIWTRVWMLAALGAWLRASASW